MKQRQLFVHIKNKKDYTKNAKTKLCGLICVNSGYVRLKIITTKLIIIIIICTNDNTEHIVKIINAMTYILKIPVHIIFRLTIYRLSKKLCTRKVYSATEADCDFDKIFLHLFSNYVKKTSS